MVGCLLAAGCGKVHSSSAAPDASDPGADGSLADATLAPSTVTVTGYNGSAQKANTALVAFQDGDGAWQAVAGQAGVYSFTVAGPRYGLLSVCARGGNDPYAVVTVGYYAVSDGTNLDVADQCTIATDPNAVRISGTITNTPAGYTVAVDDGAAGAIGGILGFNFDALKGPGTLLAVFRDPTTRAQSMVFQSPSFAQGQAYTLDYAAAIAPAQAGLTLDPTAATTTMQTQYIGSNRHLYAVDQASSAVTNYRVVPDDHLGDGLSMVQQLASDTTTSRQTAKVFKTPVAQTLTLPAAFLAVTAPHVVSMSPYPVLATTLPLRADALDYVVTYRDTAFAHAWTLTYSAAWLAASQTSFISTLPDLSQIAGWSSTYALPATGLTWNVEVDTGPAHVLPGTWPVGHNLQKLIPYQDGDATSQSASSGSL